MSSDHRTPSDILPRASLPGRRADVTGSSLDQARAELLDQRLTVDVVRSGQRRAGRHGARPARPGPGRTLQVGDGVQLTVSTGTPPPPSPTPTPAPDPAPAPADEPTEEPGPTEERVAKPSG